MSSLQCTLHSENNKNSSRHSSRTAPCHMRCYSHKSVSVASLSTFAHSIMTERQSVPRDPTSLRGLSNGEKMSRQMFSMETVHRMQAPVSSPDGIAHHANSAIFARGYHATPVLIDQGKACNERTDWSAIFSAWACWRRHHCAFVCVFLCVADFFARFFIFFI